MAFFIQKSPRSFFSVAVPDEEHSYCGFLINLWIFDLLKQRVLWDVFPFEINRAYQCFKLTLSHDNPRENHNAGVCVCVCVATEHNFISKFDETYQKKAELIGR